MALGASDAPNATLGACDAPNVALGFLGSCLRGLAAAMRPGRMVPLTQPGWAPRPGAASRGRPSLLRRVRRGGEVREGLLEGI
ncbi:hypothetical protein DMP23_39670 [Amycolatopsis sp. A1MSW2902]